MSSAPDRPLGRLGRRLGTALGCLLALALALTVIERLGLGLAAWEGRVLHHLAALRSPGRDRFFSTATWLGSIYVLAPLVAALACRWWRARRANDAALLCLALLGASGLAALAKQVFGRARPALAPVVGPLVDGYSFPSSHSAQAVAVAGAWALILYRRGRLSTGWCGVHALAMLVGVAIVALSRLYLQVHFPSDVVGGLVLGGLWLAALSLGLTGDDA